MNYQYLLATIKQMRLCEKCDLYKEDSILFSRNCHGDFNYHYGEFYIYYTINSFQSISVPIYKHFRGFHSLLFPLLP